MAAKSFLVRALALALLAGLAFLIWGVLQSLSPAADKTPPTLRIDLTEIPLDHHRVVEWRGQSVVVFRPGPLSAKELAALNSQTSGPYVENELVPPAFVYFKRSTYLGCELAQADHSPLVKVWRDVCHVGTWDRAGRRLSGADQQGQALRNLDVPLFQYAGDNRFVVLM